MNKMIVIGLDAASPELVFKKWRNCLPNIDRLMRNGIYGYLESTVPPITIPAWASMLSGKDPGQLGCYGFRNRKNYLYEEPSIFSAEDIPDKMIWDYLESGGFASILIGLPNTYPPKEIRGIMVSSFLTPDKSCVYTYPQNIKHELDRIADGNYIIDIDEFRTCDQQQLLDQIYLMTKRRFKVLRHFIKEKPWDFFMFVEMGIDRIQHGFWRDMDKEHRLYTSETAYHLAIKKYYQYIDYEIGDLLKEVDSDTTIMVVSDHGAKRMDGAICINDWMIQKGYLKLKSPVTKRTKLSADMIDFTKTFAWADGGYCSRIFLNVKGRESLGVIPANEYETFRDQLREELMGIRDENSHPMDTKVFKPQEIYRCVNNFPPDLIVYFGNLGWRSAATVGNNRIHLFENDTGKDDANHSQHGIFILKTDTSKLIDANLTVGVEVNGLSIVDIAPTILQHYGLPHIDGMIGKSILSNNKNDYTKTLSCDINKMRDDCYTDEEADIILKRLGMLGYI